MLKYVVGGAVYVDGVLAYRVDSDGGFELKSPEGWGKYGDWVEFECDMEEFVDIEGHLIVKILGNVRDIRYGEQRSV